MWEEKVAKKEMDDYFGNATKEKLVQDLADADCLHLTEEAKDQPYVEGFELRKIRKYNPAYGDDKECICGHPYYRHFDSYEDMRAVGCKYCGCYDFKPTNQED